MALLRGDFIRSASSGPFLFVLIASVFSQDIYRPLTASPRSAPCTPFEFKCMAVDNEPPSRPCYARHWKCDGENDCGNGYDEANCRNSSTGSFCNSTTFVCSGGMRIPIGYVCDGENDCPTSEDEHHCHFPSFRQPKRVTVMNLTTSTEVHLLCKAVGYPPPKVIWFHNGTLPSDRQIVSEECNMSGSRYERTSTLKINYAVTDDTGSYTCEAMNAMGRIISYSFQVNVV